ncbi:chromosome segregation protein SMC [Rubrivivax benzoatilyticus]|uniref:Chromosome partition protein Smc n=1 Tax=Rubrivivax benzoatilyticus TaxID=316997 RepID=A0ABX0HYP5_9BURK|nr:chromosome segregation protein SMC [Rubrivivax benzoatilyticus]EGJ10338.1 chromosome segregation protein SMC [Rubrivivax benzoatilyticus JA2 = ATCC BAA-35]NHK98469.1 chromosome segregation protein SMC [Rubrivivax benzoatilyticus]NHL23756.1 chromosome segregation protein SMC [Rubrivivax benzoatilyticus]
MRLNQIKLAGFKSFAEPTTFQLPGQRVGVVGPNGCGKSNIMDAVRWVLGESKASELRGESMQDVIFNGSGQRKPASRASVELVFDNSSARAGGQWNAFSEIAVKRVLTRDGTSSYFINNQPVRRRDVQDVFLGTGLGPRAYAIIGQGTISRIIESRPEELRLFLEEAAGVSKYKERRRETENRLKDTRENLTRVEDILRELNLNLEKLEKQAEVAAAYRRLQDDGTTKLHQLWFLKARDAAGEEERVKTAVLAATNVLEQRLAELRHVEAELEQLRQAHYEASDELHARQGSLSEAALEVSRLEERIRYVVDGRQRAEQRLAALDAQNEGWRERQTAAEAELEDIAGQIVAADEEADVLVAQAEDQGLELPALEDGLRAAQADANRQRNAVTQVQQQIQVLAADSRNLDEQARQLRTRRERLAGERQQLQAPDTARLDALREDEAVAAERHEEAEGRLHELSEQVPALDEQRRAAQAAVNRENARQADIAARLEALRTLQEKVQTEGKLKPWLERHGLTGMQGLWRQVHIEPGWETALEAALRERLNALAVGRLDTVRAFAADAPPAKLAFYALPSGAIASTHATLPRLADLLRLGDAGLKALLGDWLEGVYTADSLDAALAARGQLTHGEIVMTREGHAVSQYAVAFYAPDSEQAGLLARAQEIENLDRQQRAQALIAEEARTQSVRLEAAYTEASGRLSAARREAAEAQNRAHALHVELLRLSQQAEAALQRREQLGDELAEIDAQMEAIEERRAVGEARFEELDVELGDAQQRHADLEDEVIAADRRLADAREQQRALERQAQEARFQARSLAARRDELQRALETAAAQIAANEQAAEQIRTELAGFDDAAAEAGLQDALALRLERERELGAARSRYDDLSAQMRRADEQRLGLEHGMAPLREQITKLQLEQQAAQLGGAQYLEQLQAAEVDLEALASGIEQGGVKLWGLQSEIDRINREIAALGAVNLAALDELTASRERKTFLDAQLADLTDAINTLEDAIRKIDLETRDLLGSTFNQVNEHFGRMFPSLFGGGQARLVMTGDEILDAGVQVMAQPPGKKNSTIHLLSGGEKALTAIALVFAIFQLNPAPFCLLDEVDAPLDDANTERYRNLVTEMSAGTQFLFISHNKIAMEMAEQLIGVTMQEQGVSRIVAVDMEAAIGFAEAA